MPDLDLTNIDSSALQESVDFLGNYADELRENTAAQEESQEKQQLEEAQAVATQKDPRDAEQWASKHQ